MYYEARNHAATYGPGKPPFPIPHRRKVTITSAALDLAMQYIMDPDKIQKVFFLTPHAWTWWLQIKRVEIKFKHIQIYYYVCVQLAVGTHDLVLSDGTKLTVPNIARQALKEHLWAGFVREHTDAAGKYTGGISRKDFLDTSKCATKGDQKTFAALDQIKVLFLDLSMR